MNEYGNLPAVVTQEILERRLKDAEEEVIICKQCGDPIPCDCILYNNDGSLKMTFKVTVVELLTI